MSIEFVDGIADVFVVGQTARMEFFVLRPDPHVDRSKSERPELARTPASITVAMPLEALVNSVSYLERIRAGMVESGLLKVRDAQGGESAREEQPRSVSPNFDSKLRQ